MITLINQSFVKDRVVSKYALVFDVSLTGSDNSIENTLGAQMVRNMNTKVRYLPAYKHLLNSEVHWLTRNMSPQDHLLLRVVAQSETLSDSLGFCIGESDLQAWVSRFSYPLNLWLLLDFPNSGRFLPQDFEHVFYCDAEMQVKKRAHTGSGAIQARRAFCCMVAVDTSTQSTDFSLSREFASVLAICRGRATLMTILKALSCRLRATNVTPLICCNRSVPLEKTFFYFG
jgi:hypothetical protein